MVYNIHLATLVQIQSKLSLPWYYVNSGTYLHVFCIDTANNLYKVLLPVGSTDYNTFTTTYEPSATLVLSVEDALALLANGFNA